MVLIIMLFSGNDEINDTNVSNDTRGLSESPEENHKDSESYEEVSIIHLKANRSYGKYSFNN